MDNKDYLQWEPMLKKLAYKYRNNKVGLEIEDLIQIAAIGLLESFDTYKEGAGASKLTYYYTCSEREIKKEIKSLRCDKRYSKVKTVSLDAPVIDEDDAYISDIIPDAKINTEASVIEEITIENYKYEIERFLEGEQKEVFLLRVFSEKSDPEIANYLNIKYKRVRHIFVDARRKLIRKSKLIKLRFFELQEAKSNNWSSHNWARSIQYKTEIENLKKAIKRENKDKNLAKLSIKTEYKEAI